jgi:hypothetical protein
MVCAMNTWATVLEDLATVERENHGRLSMEQQLQVIHIRALLAIAQELSTFRDDGVHPVDNSGSSVPGP